MNKQVQYKQICEILYSLQIPLTFADCAYILRNPLTVAESRTTSYICLLRNPHQNKWADKAYVTDICMRNPLKFCLWNPLIFLSIFKTCLWNPGIYRQKIVLLSSAQFGLVMIKAEYIPLYIWPLTFTESNYILRNPLTAAEYETTTYIRLLRNLQHNKCTDNFLRYKYSYTEST